VKDFGQIFKFWREIHCASHFSSADFSAKEHHITLHFTTMVGGYHDDATPGKPNDTRP
jgi:hypothetical protein